MYFLILLVITLRSFGNYIINFLLESTIIALYELLIEVNNPKIDPFTFDVPNLVRSWFTSFVEGVAAAI